jgi:hypothetical protein
MSIDISILKNDIAKVVGDLGAQYTTEIEIELANAVREITTTYKFYWNINRTANVSHTNGIINLPTNTAKVFMVYDSEGNSKYKPTDPVKFFVHRDGFQEPGYPNRGLELPFIRQINKTTGVEYIELDTGSDTDASLTFNLVHTTYYENVETWMPNRLRTIFLGYTVDRILNRIDNPDTQLLTYYINLWNTALKSEINFGSNSEFSNYNYKVLSDSMAIRSGSNGV